MFRAVSAAVLFICMVVSSGCTFRSFRVKDVLKTPIDQVADVHLHEVTGLARSLMIKLYKRNPAELRKTSGCTIDDRVRHLFEAPHEKRFVELDNKTSIDAMLLCFDEGFAGDRVFAVSVGLLTMLRQSYNNKEEFFLFDTLDQQKLYNSARNIEILVWRLSKRRDKYNRLFLVTNELKGETTNLSFERLFGKMIVVQDVLAKTVSGRTNRAINSVVQRLATAAFIPL